MAGQPFDQRDGVIWFNGELIPWTEAKLHVLSHALHYASSVFEGERAYGGEIFKLREHTERLFHSARSAWTWRSPTRSRKSTRPATQTLAAQGYQDAYVQTRRLARLGNDGCLRPDHASINVAIAVWEWPSYFDPEERAQERHQARYFRMAQA